MREFILHLAVLIALPFIALWSMAISCYLCFKEGGHGLYQVFDCYWDLWFGDLDDE